MTTQTYLLPLLTKLFFRKHIISSILNISEEMASKLKEDGEISRNRASCAASRRSSPPSLPLFRRTEGSHLLQFAESQNIIKISKYEIKYEMKCQTVVFRLQGRRLRYLKSGMAIINGIESRFGDTNRHGAVP